jgi:hypothetical protein
MMQKFLGLSGRHVFPLSYVGNFAHFEELHA